MTLRTKTVLIIGSALIGLLILLLSVSSTILLKGFTHLENKTIENKVNCVVNALFEELNKLATEAGNYATLDNLHAYMKTHDKAHISKHFIENTFDSLNLNLLVLLDHDGEIVFDQAYDATDHQFKPVTQSFHNSLRSQLYDQIAGIMLLPEQVMLVASHPLLTSKNNDDSNHGTLIMGRILNDQKIQKISQLTHLAVSIQRIDKEELPDDVIQEGTSSLTQSTVVQILDKKSIAGYTVIKDIYQQPAVLLQVKMSREIYQQGLTSLWFLSVFVLIFVLIFAGLILWLFENLVLARLALLSREVEQVSTTDEFSTVTVEGNDELTHLASSINEMLKEVRKIGDILVEAQRITHLGNWDWDITTNRFYCSDEIYRIFGLRLRARMPHYELFLHYVHPDDRRKVSSVINKAMSEDKPYSIEHRIKQQDGTVRYIHTRGEQLRDRTGQVIHIIGTLQDITERKLAQEQTLRLLEENRFLAHRTLAIKEEESKKLAQELHDEFGQCITAIQADAEAITVLAEEEDNPNPRCLEKIVLSADAIVNVSTHMYDVVHTMMRQLRPTSLDDLGLVETLRELVTTWQTRHKTPCAFKAMGELHHLGEAINISIYRVVQECLTNVKKYAEASQVKITLNTNPMTQILTLCIQDNGIGMDTQDHKRGLGLIGMRERAQALDGQWQLESMPKQGVKIIFTIPIAEEYLQKHRKWKRI